MPINNAITTGNGGLFSSSVASWGGFIAAIVVGGGNDSSIYQIREITAGIVPYASATPAETLPFANDYENTAGGGFRSPIFRLSIIKPTTNLNPKDFLGVGIKLDANGNFDKSFYKIIHDEWVLAWSARREFSATFGDSDSPGVTTEPNSALIVLITGPSYRDIAAAVMTSNGMNYLNVRSVRKNIAARSDQRVAGNYKLGDV